VQTKKESYLFFYGILRSYSNIIQFFKKFKVFLRPQKYLIYRVIKTLRSLLTGNKLDVDLGLGSLPQIAGQGIAIIDLHHQRLGIAAVGTLNLNYAKLVYDLKSFHKLNSHCLIGVLAVTEVHMRGSTRQRQKFLKLCIFPGVFW